MNYNEIPQQTYLHSGPILKPWHFIPNKFEWASDHKHLDVGCGSGGFLKALVPNYVEKHGIDLDIDALKFADNSEIIVSLMDLNEYVKVSDINTFDSITIFEVIEHVKDVELFLSNLSLLVKSKGLIWGSTPNNQRLWLKIFPREDFDFPPNHLHYFDKEQLKIIFSKSGFNIIWLGRAFILPSFGCAIYRAAHITNNKLCKFLITPLVWIFLTICNLTIKGYLHHGFVLVKK